MCQMLVQALPDPAILISPEGKIDACNPAAATLLEYQLHELTGADIGQVLTRAQLNQIPLNVLQQTNGSSIKEVDQPVAVICRAKDTRLLNLKASGVLLPDTNHIILLLQRSNAYSDESALQLRHVIENSEDAIVLVGNDLGIRTWNRGAREMYFYRATEVFGRSILELFPSDQRKQAAGLFESVRKGFAINQYECEQLRNSNLPFTASISIAPLQGTSTHAGFSFQARDISLKRQAEDRLQASEEQFRQLADNIKEVFWLRTESEMLYISPAYEQVFGRSCASLYNDPDSFLDAIHPDDKNRVMETIQRNFHSKSPVEIEYRITRPDATMRWIRARTFPVAGSYDEPRITGIAEDITARKETENSLRISEANLARAQQLAGLGYWRWDIKNNSLFWSDALYRFIGKDPREFQPDPDSLMQHIYPEDRELTQNSINHSLATGLPHTSTFRIVSTTGQVRYMKTSGEVSFGQDGEPEQMFGIAMDVTEQHFSEMVLRDSEERFRSIFEQSTLGMAILHLDGSIERVNPVLCDMLGYPELELLKLTFAMLTTPDSETLGLDQIQLLIEGESGGCLLETEYIRKDESTFPALVNASCLMDSSGAAFRIVIQIQDITELQQTQSQLRRSQETLSIAEKLSHIGTFDWEVESDSLYWSEETYRIFGVEPGSITPSFDLSYSHIFEDDKERFLNSLKHAMDNHETWDQEFRLRRADGSIRHIHTIATLHVEKDRDRRMVGSIMDITERKNIEQQLRYSEERLRLLSDAASEGVVIHDMGRITDCNQALSQMFQIAEPLLIGSDVLELIHPDDRHISQKRIESHTPGPYEVRGLRSDGSSFPMLITALESSLHNEPVRVVLVQDISISKEAEAASQRASSREAELQMLKLAAATYAHEINNPLTGIRATLQMLTDQSSQCENADLIQDAIEATERISSVIAKMQQLDNPQMRQYLDREIIDINQ